MKPTLLNGRKQADLLIEELQAQRKTIPHRMRLGIVLVGKNLASVSYVHQKQKIGKRIGIEVDIFHYSESISNRNLRSAIGSIARKPYMYGVIVQLPLPHHLHTQSIVNAILPHVDVDVLTTTSLGKMYTEKLPIVPPTIASINALLNHCTGDIAGKIVAIIGYGTLVGKPATVFFAQKKATLLLIQSTTRNAERLIQMADIIITGTGKPNTLQKHMVKPGAIILDAGFTKTDATIKGDVESSAYSNASFYSPVPNGIGSLTVAYLFYNVLTLYKQKIK